MAELAMSEERRRLLRSAVDACASTLELDDVISYLHSRGVLPDHVIDTLQGEQSQRDRCNQFVRQLQRRGNNAFVLFYESLMKTNQRHLASLLEGELTADELSSSLSKLSSSSSSSSIPEVEISLLNLRSPVDENRPFSEAVEQNRLFYSDYRYLNVKESRGILDDLHVEFVDNRSADAIVFDRLSMYRNFSSPRGLALIISNRYFPTMPERLGTEIDEANLKNLFSQLGYTVVQYKNLTAKEMHNAIRQFGRRGEHSLVDSCVVCVLTHGENGQLFGVDEECLPVVDFVAQLNANNCPVLAQKPKLFFLQACRGDRRDNGFNVFGDRPDGYLKSIFKGTAAPRNRVITDPDSRLKLPVEADILIAYATTPGYVSWRNSLRGTWFVQSICEIFAKHANRLDILSMLTMVNKRVAEAYESAPGSFKQIPDMSSRLRLSFYFFPGAPRPADEPA